MSRYIVGSCSSSCDSNLKQFISWSNNELVEPNKNPNSLPYHSRASRMRCSGVVWRTIQCRVCLGFNLPRIIVVPNLNDSGGEMRGSEFLLTVDMSDFLS